MSDSFNIRADMHKDRQPAVGQLGFEWALDVDLMPIGRAHSDARRARAASPPLFDRPLFRGSAP
eukprot:877576-Pyramimonas_sp.AAC.1